MNTTQEHIVETVNKINIMSAYCAGEQIEVRERGQNCWIVVEFPPWNWTYFEYRVKK